MKYIVNILDGQKFVNLILTQSELEYVFEMQLAGVYAWMMDNESSRLLYENFLMFEKHVSELNDYDPEVLLRVKELCGSAFEDALNITFTLVSGPKEGANGKALPCVYQQRFDQQIVQTFIESFWLFAKTHFDALDENYRVKKDLSMARFREIWEMVLSYNHEIWAEKAITFAEKKSVTEYVDFTIQKMLTREMHRALYFI